MMKKHLKKKTVITTTSLSDSHSLSRVCLILIKINVCCGNQFKICLCFKQI